MAHSLRHPFYARSQQKYSLLTFFPVIHRLLLFRFFTSLWSFSLRRCRRPRVAVNIGAIPLQTTLLQHILAPRFQLDGAFQQSITPVVSLTSYVRVTRPLPNVSMHIPNSFTTGTLVMQDERRGEASRKTPLRLPAIAPKDDHSSSASSSRSGQPSAGPSIPPRARLPPRSRTGCWTCRTRKVKCDEGRPICGQCTRLGHDCDYNPRLSFRDDTPRVVERMQEVSIVGSSIWDGQ